MYMYLHLLCTFLHLLQQLDEMIIHLPYSNATPIHILEVYAIRGELYFHVLCLDNVVQILHYRVLKALAPELYRNYFRKRNLSF